MEVVTVRGAPVWHMRPVEHWDQQQDPQWAAMKWVDARHMNTTQQLHGSKRLFTRAPQACMP